MSVLMILLIVGIEWFFRKKKAVGQPVLNSEV